MSEDNGYPNLLDVDVDALIEKFNSEDHEGIVLKTDARSLAIAKTLGALVNEPTSFRQIKNELHEVYIPWLSGPGNVESPKVDLEWYAKRLLELDPGITLEDVEKGLENVRERLDGLWPKPRILYPFDFELEMFLEEVLKIVKECLEYHESHQD